MKPRRLCALAPALAALLACSSGGGARDLAPAPPTRVQYGPFSASYVAVSHGSVRQELPGGQVGTADFEQRYYLSVGVLSAAAGLVAELIVDSVPVVRGSDLEPLRDEATAAAGARFASPLAISGELTGFEGGDPENPLLRQIASRLETFFLRLPKGGAVPGMSWADTTSTETVSSGIALAVRSIQRHVAVGWEEGHGSTTLHVRTESHYTVSGEGTQSGQLITIDGAGRRHSERFVDTQGRYLVVTATDTTELTASVAAVGIDVPILQTRHDTLRILP